MKKYRKLPVVIEAIQFTGTKENSHDITEFIKGGLFFPTKMPKYERLVITTLEGEMTARVGDWIIKGVKGEFYPCKPDIFEKTYEEVD